MMNQFEYPDSAFSARSTARAVRVLAAIMRTRSKPRHLEVGIIGFPKCGTTTLHKSLLANKRLRGVPHETQTIDYFNDALYNSINFLKNPNLIYEPWWLWGLEKKAGPAKYILCLRDPVAALHSFYWYRRREIEDPSSWIKPKKRDRVPDEVAVMLGEAELIGASRCRVDYAKWIEHLVNFIPSKQVYCITLERLHGDTAGVEYDLGRFLGSEINLRQHFKSENVNASKPTRSRDELERTFGNDGFFHSVRNKTNTLLMNEWGIENTYW